MLALYDYFRSSACFRVRIALNLKRLPYHIIPIHLINNGGEQFSASYQNINPQSLVPTLKDDYNLVTQSLAIIEYLNDLYPEPPLLPKDVLNKAHVRAFALAIVADIHPLNNVRVLQYLNQE
jgi:maleylacetoacetate isomerase